VARRSFEPKEYEESVISIDRVTKVVKGGKKMKFRVLVVVGNKKGKVGIGIGKAIEIPLAITKGITAAKRNLISFTLKGTTLPFSTKTRTGAGWVYLQPAVTGTGIVAGGVVRQIMEKVGVQDVLTKSLGSSNSISLAAATIDGLREIEQMTLMRNLRRQDRINSEPRSAEARQ
jgi:small subunit ribosomal protein S5